MKKIIYGLLATVAGVVLLFSYRTSLDAVAPAASTGGTTRNGTSTGSSGSTSTGSTTSAGSTASGSTSTSSPSSSASASASSSSLKDGSFTGQAVDTRYGPVQVRITVSGGKITKVSVPQYPTQSFRDQQINQQAVPTLVSETLSAQSAKIDMVSGATYTSDGYLQSLQSALDGARA
ncbi:FMN-binding protein [Humibacter sp. RRB41]|uniref:FMN-binding protein n=1 Tax=Humibacter sp. RRB41 TaxID=2919946 RepID=UPI001FA94465|nr:FMN-binding protein [Humibacter sp. RRB41]